MSEMIDGLGRARSGDIDIAGPRTQAAHDRGRCRLRLSVSSSRSVRLTHSARIVFGHLFHRLAVADQALISTSKNK